MHRVGVVALQGDYERHIQAVRGAGGEAFEVRTPEELAEADRAILPGGESSTFGILMRTTGLDEALKQRAAEGMPIWGTCMGMIMMASSIEGRPGQPTLGLLDIEVRRNAFGAQLHSFEDEIALEDGGGTVTGVFIRAPVVTRVGAGVDVLARYDGKVVGVRSGRLLGTSFHPELTDDLRMHRRFLEI